MIVIFVSLAIALVCLLASICVCLRLNRKVKKRRSGFEANSGAAKNPISYKAQQNPELQTQVTGMLADVPVHRRGTVQPKSTSADCSELPKAKPPLELSVEPVTL